LKFFFFFFDALLGWSR